MTRANIVLLAILIACSLGLVTAQHKARKLFVELEKEQKLAKDLGVEWGQLQIEQSTWATHARIEKIAATSLGMRQPDATKTRTVILPDHPVPPASAQPDAEGAQ